VALNDWGHRAVGRRRLPPFLSPHSSSSVLSSLLFLSNVVASALLASYIRAPVPILATHPLPLHYYHPSRLPHIACLPLHSRQKKANKLHLCLRLGLRSEEVTGDRPSGAQVSVLPTGMRGRG
jgi:hypothetical protein